MKKFAALVAVLALVAFAAPAFAANPFMDVPMNHWAYDAVSQLASRGVVSGYPDGAFKGEWKATRYEMASVVARALAYVDMNKASKQDLELLKKLVVEFKDELDALGVKVDELDARVAVLEDRLGGWEIGGYFRTRAIFNDDGNDDWLADRWRLNIRKYVDEKVTAFLRLQGSAPGTMSINKAYVSVKMPWDMTFTAGKFTMDFEGDLYFLDPFGFFLTDAYITDFDATHAVQLYKPFGMGDFTIYVGHDNSDSTFDGEWGDARYVYRRDRSYGFDRTVLSENTGDRYIYGARINFNFNEMFSLALNYMKYDYQSDVNVWMEDLTWYRVRRPASGLSPYWWAYSWGEAPVKTDLFTVAADTATLWADMKVNFAPGITLKGAYYMQNNDEAWQRTAMTADFPRFTSGPGDADGMDFEGPMYPDDPKAWKVILQVDQSVLGFTGLWLEYAQLDGGFVFPNGAAPYGWFSGDKFVNGFNQVAADTTIMQIYATQRWNEKWGTYIRYLNVDAGSYADYDVWTASVQYWYTPNMAFELGYDKVGGTEDGESIWFRTAVFF